MPRGGHLRLELACAALGDAAAERLAIPPGRYVRLTVADTGTGMDEATRARAFEPFFTTKEKGKGTGLGLSTVFGIAHQSGGAVSLDSAPGQGTRVIIHLPHTDAAPSVTAPAPVAEARGSETILLAEDDDQVRHLASTVLQQRGYRVLQASNGGEALLLCEQHEGAIELLITDVVMPRMSGRHLAERLAPLRPAMKVLYMTGYTDDAILRHGVAQTETALLQKPFTADELARRVRAALDG
jgi:CheY-like chemotaxis protein